MVIKTVQKNVFDIPAPNFSTFRARIEKLQKKAKKLGCGEIYFKVLEEYMGTDPSQSDFAEPARLDPPKLMKFYKVEVTGDKPKFADWVFVAKLEHDDDIGTIIKVLPEERLPQKYRESSRYNCDHCKKAIWRRDTFVVRHEKNGKMVQVGRTCLKDFLGHKDPKDIARYAEYLAMIGLMGEEAEADYPYREKGIPYYYYDLQRLLEATSAIIRVHGWVSKTKAKDDFMLRPTADLVADWYHRPNFHSGVDVTDLDREEARKAIRWAEGLSEDETWNDDYLYNISLIAKAEMADYFKLGYACSILSTYQRRKLREEERLRKIEKSEYFGEIGKRIEVGKVLCILCKNLGEGQYGERWLIKFQKDNYTFVWFTGQGGFVSKNGDGLNCFVELIRGNYYTLEKATVKDHKEYRDLKETIVQRCQLSKEE